MAGDDEERRPKEQEARDESDHGVIVAGSDAHAREQPGTAAPRDGAPKREA